MLGKYYLPLFPFPIFHLASALAYAFLSLNEPPVSFKTNLFFKASLTFSDRYCYLHFCASEHITPTSVLAHITLWVTYALVSFSPWGTHSCKFRESSSHLTQPLPIPLPERAVTQSKEGRRKQALLEVKDGLVWRKDQSQRE